MTDNVLNLRQAALAPDTSRRANAPMPAAAAAAPLPTVEAISDVLDRTAHATLARLTGGLSPGALAAAYFDWAAHLATSPGAQLRLAEKAGRLGFELFTMAACSAAEAHAAKDRRFADEAWRRPPFDLIAEAFLMTQDWWDEATSTVRGVSRQHQRMVSFGARQWLDLMSPSNNPVLNPEIMEATLKQYGFNLVRGMRNMLEDLQKQAEGRPLAAVEQFEVGRDLAVTQGKVVYRNHLIELIRYSPTTERVRPEPILITPAWIMKYYILDLAPENSLVKYLVDSGFTVFIISWRNPGPEDRDIGFDDYRRLGVMAALDAIETLSPGAKVHAAGYCLGGTLLTIAAAAMARDGDDRLASISLLAAQVDFTEAGELTLFIDEGQVAFLEDLMWGQGYLDASQMAGAFQLLRSNDLIWSKIQKDYLLGEREPVIDMMAWNADATRMPFRMHAEYLRGLFLNNDLAERRFEVEGAPVAVADIRAPIFALGATRDHVAPWRSVYKIHYFSETDVTFALTEGGHNGGVVSPPSRVRPYYVKHTPHGEREVDHQRWRTLASQRRGSWWTEWSRWLDARSGPPIPPPVMRGANGKEAADLIDAPGAYVRQR